LLASSKFSLNEVFLHCLLALIQKLFSKFEKFRHMKNTAFIGPNLASKRSSVFLENVFIVLVMKDLYFPSDERCDMDFYCP
jgi:hypothetical protein